MEKKTKMEKRADVNFWYNDKRRRPMIQPALGVKLGTKEEMRNEVIDYCKRNGYELTFILKIIPRN